MANLTQLEMSGDSFGDNNRTNSFNIVFLKGGFEGCLHLKSLPGVHARRTLIESTGIIPPRAMTLVDLWSGVEEG